MKRLVFIFPILLSFAFVWSTDKEQAFSYENYAAVLSEFVDAKGMVDYAGLKGRRQKLDAFVASMDAVDRLVYESWDDRDKIAFLINAYNAYTLLAIIDHYPIRSSFFRSLFYPKNSIQQIPGIWGTLRFGVAGRKLTLRDIEDRILRREFDEPRIHMALVCAAIGCPPLRREPFVGETLEVQLDDQTRRFLSQPGHFRIDRDGSTLYLSSIFDWYGRDFLQSYRTREKFSGRSATERAVLNFLSHYLDPSDRKYLETADYRVRYIDYDWSLNEQARYNSHS